MKNRLCAKILVMVLLICCVLLTSMTAMAEWKPVRYCLRCKSAANFVEFRKYSRDRHDLWYRCTSCNLLQSLALEMHTLEQHEGKVPTCTEYGWNPYVTCDACGYTTYETLNKDPNNHDLVEHEGKAPTCMEYGWDPYQTCTRCDYSTYKKLPVQHDLVHHEGKEWSCTEKGWLPYDTCNLCDYSTYRLVGPHFGELVDPKEPTCTEIGWYQYIKCSLCDSILARYIERPALGHVPEANKSVVTKPTCTEDGYTTHTCSVCKVTYTADVVKAPGHSYKTVVTEPTCTEDGYTTYTCSVCEYTYTGDNVSKLKHDPEQHEAQAPTCTEIGWDAYETCKREGCDYTTYVEKEAPGHDPEQHEAQAPTCTEIGWDAYETCKREGCTYTTYVELPALGHDYQKTVVQPTCEKGGYTRYTCTLCEDTYTENPVKKLLHWYGEWMPNGDGTHSADCRRADCRHVGKTDCQKFDFIVEIVENGENEHMVFCPVCGEVENGERLELIEKATATAVTGKLPSGELVARMNQEYLSLAFEYAGKLTTPRGQVTITLPAETLQAQRLVLVAPDGTETELPFELAGEEISFTVDFAEGEIPVMLLKLVAE